MRELRKNTLVYFALLSALLLSSTASRAYVNGVKSSGCGQYGAKNVNVAQGHGGTQQGDLVTQKPLSINGGRISHKREKSKKGTFRAIILPKHAQGFDSPAAAARAFYLYHEDDYQQTDSDTELTGFVLVNAEKKYYFTNAVIVSSSFKLVARLELPKSWKRLDFLHTHPGGVGFQEGFSVGDREAVKRGAAPGYYVRTPNGDIRYIDKKIAKQTRRRWGAAGVSKCADAGFCLPAYGEDSNSISGEQLAKLR